MNKAEFGKRLRMDMSKQGITFRRLAELTGLTIHVLSYMTAGKGSFYRDRLEKVSEVFHYSPEIWPPLDGDTAPKPKVRPTTAKITKSARNPTAAAVNTFGWKATSFTAYSATTPENPAAVSPLNVRRRADGNPDNEKEVKYRGIRDLHQNARKRERSVKRTASRL